MDNEVLVSEIKTIRWEKWTALGTIVMALCALLSSLWQGYSLQQHNQLSLRPYLQLEVNVDRISADEYTLSMYMNNNGLGPADVTSVSFFLNGEAIQNTAAIWAAMRVEPGPDCQFGSGHVQRFYKVGDSQMVISAALKGCRLTEAQLKHLSKALQINVSYSSLYGEAFEASWSTF